MEKVIKLAIEGGYKAKGLRPLDFAFITTGKPDAKLNQLLSVILLDPLFWQCLGKALGNDESIKIELPVIQKTEEGRFGYVMEKVPYWRIMWHRFIDHLAEGKDVNEFFKEILK